jgi:Flp pilus assembly protein TadG
VAQMKSLTERARDERGLMGKITLLWLALLILLVIAAIDTGSILYTRYKVADAADEASFEAATVYKDTQNQQAALQAALAKVKELTPGAHLDFKLDAKTGEVTLTVTKEAWSLLAGRLSFTERYVKVVETATNGPPVL